MMSETHPIVFLDIDGVLNNTPCCPKGPRIMPRQAENLAALIRASEASIVLTSAWRKWVDPKCMTLLGFSRLLYTHGIDAEVDVLPGDYDARDLQARAAGIVNYMMMNPVKGRRCEAIVLKPYVVLDDKPVPVEHLVQTDGHVGLACDNVMKAYRILRDQQ